MPPHEGSAVWPADLTMGKLSEPSLDDTLRLARIALDALKMKPPLYVSSLLGPPWTWRDHRRYSEFGILSPWHVYRSLKFLVDVTLPSFPRTPPPGLPSLLERLYWQPTVILQRPDHNGAYTTYPDEAWFFVNGIMTNDDVAQLNAAYIAYLFHRPVTLIQNSTTSGLLDLVECALGKHWYRTTEAAIKTLPPIYDALKSKHRQRVVVIAHSQGTIIMAHALKLLCDLTRPPTRGLPGEDRYAGPLFVYPHDEPLDLSDFEFLTEDELAKLEIYLFANCATTMSYYRLPSDGRPPLPWIESFGNQYDIVARLGMLAPYPGRHDIHLDGPIYERRGGWGHLLNKHYLMPIEAAQRRGYKRGGQAGRAPYTLANSEFFLDAAPRLFSYINGGSPTG